MPPGPALHRPGRCSQPMQGGGARRRTGGDEPGLDQPPAPAVFDGGSAPGPRGTFCSCKKYPKTRQPPSGWTPALLSNRLPADLAGAQPLNAKILRGSDLYRASRRCFGRWPCKRDTCISFPVSDCLRLGEALWLPSTKTCKIFSTRGLCRKKQKPLSARGPSGEVRYSLHRLRGSRRQRGISAATGCTLAGVRFGKKGVRGPPGALLPTFPAQ